jgi:hypothetical protein
VKDYSRGWNLCKVARLKGMWRDGAKWEDEEKSGVAGLRVQLCMVTFISCEHAHEAREFLKAEKRWGGSICLLTKL